MAIILKRYSDSGRTNVLKNTVTSAKADKENGNQYINGDVIKAIETFLVFWLEKLNLLNKLLGDRSKEVREKNEATGYLDQVLRDMWEVLKRRVSRLQQPAEVLTYYGLPQGGKIPSLQGEKSLLAFATKAIVGDAKAVEAGYPAMQNPDAGELQAALESAQKEIADVAPADRAYDQAEEAVDELRGQADEHIADIVDELKYNLRKKDPASQRRIIKSYGIEIKYNKNEQVSEEESIL